MGSTVDRRTFLGAIAAGCGAMAWESAWSSTRPDGAGGGDFSLNYMVSSAMYGKLPLDQVLDEVPRCGARLIDIWPAVHANHREQIEDMGLDKFSQLLETTGVGLGCITRYDLGPFRIHEDFELARRFQCPRMVCGGAGPKGLHGSDLKSAVSEFLKRLQPTSAKAADQGLRLAIENHGNNLINTPDSLLWLVDEARKQKLPIGVALAPYHLETLGLDAPQMARLIRELGDGLEVFYAWQHGMGCMNKLPRVQERLQLPGRGDLNFKPILDALKAVQFKGVTSIFMHPVPRGIPIADGGAASVTFLINQSRTYLGQLH